MKFSWFYGLLLDCWKKQNDCYAKKAPHNSTIQREREYVVFLFLHFLFSTDWWTASKWTWPRSSSSSLPTAPPPKSSSPSSGRPRCSVAEAAGTTPTPPPRTRLPSASAAGSPRWLRCWPARVPVPARSWACWDGSPTSSSTSPGKESRVGLTLNFF